MGEHVFGGRMLTFSKLQKPQFLALHRAFLLGFLRKGNSWAPHLLYGPEPSKAIAS